MWHSVDSWYAVASAMLAARAGMPRSTATAVMSAAFSACSRSTSTVWPSTSAVQPLLSSRGGTAPRSTSTTAVATAPSATTAPMAAVRRDGTGALVGVQRRVEGDPLALPRHRLDGAADRVAAEEDVVDARERGGLRDRRLAVHVGDGHLGARGDVAAGLDDAVVPEGDADAGVGADQAAFADGDGLLAAAGQGAHDRGAATDVGAVAHDDARGDPALDHGGAEGAGVVVDEALVHHGGAGGQVGAEADPVGVGDADTAGQHVVHHPRELVDAEHRHVLARGAQPGAR